MQKVLLMFFVVLFISIPVKADEYFQFTINIENVSTDSTLMPSDNSKQPVPLAPGVWMVHDMSAPYFTDGSADRMEGLEALAEDGDPSALAAALSQKSGIMLSGVFNTPVGASAPGPLLPGSAYEFSFNAKSGSYVSFATMFVPSNDLFYSPDTNGIALFDESGNPVSGEVTAYIKLWDAGTEENQEPGVGADQPQRQSGPNTGAADPDNTVRLVNDGFTYPEVSQVIKVVINPPVTGIENTGSTIAGSFELNQNYPNPFNPETNISYTISNPGRVKLSVYNVLGEKIADLVNAYQSSGTYQITWNGLSENGVQAPSGLYFYRLESNSESKLRKMILIR